MSVDPRTWTLRAQLVTALVGLLVATICTVGLLTVVSLDRFLENQLDEQLSASVFRARAEASRQEGNHHFDGDDRPTPGFLLAPGQAAGTLGAVVYNNQVMRAGVLNEAGATRSISAESASELASVTAFGTPVTIDLGPGLGDYRVVGAPGPSGSVLVTGLPLNSVESTVRQLAIIIAVVALVGTGAAAVAATGIITAALRPLRKVANTATQVANMPLDSGEVALAIRVPPTDTDPRTEVGQVGSALNHLLENVAAALTARHESEQRVRNFVADASHELRTPLASIRGYSELTLRNDDSLPENTRHALSRIESESVRMTSLVDDLLLLARLDAGRPLDMAPVDLSALLVACVSDAHASGSNHHWHLDVPDYPVEVIGDADRLHQVVANVLTNARIHTPAGSTVSVALTVEPAPVAPQAGALAAQSPAMGGKLATIRITDNGPGINPDLLPEIFDRFTRADSSRSRTAGSTGLGLAIAAAVVHAHHGLIRVTSQPGRTEFTITLPYTN